MWMMQFGWLKTRRGEIRKVTTAVNMRWFRNTKMKIKYKEHSTEWKIEPEETIPKLSKVNGKFVFPHCSVHQVSNENLIEADYGISWSLTETSSDI